MNTSAHHNIQLHLGEIELLLREEVGKIARREIIAIRSSTARQHKKEHTNYRARVTKLSNEATRAKMERDRALEWAAECEERARDAEFALRDGQAFSRQLGRELEELKGKQNANPIS